MANQLSETSSLLDNVRTELREAVQQREKEEGRLSEVEALLDSVRRERDSLQVSMFGHVFVRHVVFALMPYSLGVFGTLLLRVIYT